MSMLDSDEVLAELDSAFTAVPVDGWSAAQERQTRSRNAVRELAQTLSESVTIKEVAAILGVDRSRVSRRITGNTLWAFDLRGTRRIPRWQFLDNGLLPGLDTVVPAVPPGTTPAVLGAFMHTAQPDFNDRTPIDYLAAGGDPTVVAGFVADLARW